MHLRRVLALTSLTLLALAPSTVPTQASVSRHSPSEHAGGSSTMRTLLDWQLLAIDTVYVGGRIVLPPVTDPPAAAGPVPIPVGTLFLGYTALAVRDAVQR